VTLLAIYVYYNYGSSKKHGIYRVELSTSIVSRYAGAGIAGYGGDGGLALHANIGITGDTAGNIYVAEQGNARIRYIDKTTGIISTIAGSGACHS